MLQVKMVKVSNILSYWIMAIPQRLGPIFLEDPGMLEYQPAACY
jgi:hypothetical protein